MDDELPENLTYSHTTHRIKQEAPERCGGCGMSRHLESRLAGRPGTGFKRVYRCGACGWEVTL